MAAELNPLAERIATALTRAHPEFAADREVLEQGDVQFFLEAPASSNAGALGVLTERGEDVWIRFGPPQMFYSVENEGELLTILDALLTEEALFVRIVDAQGKWAGTTLVRRADLVHLEDGQKATVLSWSGRFDREYVAETPAPSWIEFHDSTLVAVDALDMRVELLLDAYVHAWEGVGDARRGTGWIQPVRIALTEARTSPVGDVLPLDIADGHMTVGAAVHRNLVPLPFTAMEPTALRLELSTAEVFEFAGTSVDVRATGPARYVEDLPADP